LRRRPASDKITAPSFRDLSPRFNLVYDLSGDGRTALKFAANRYGQPINISSPGYQFVGANGRCADDLRRPVSNEYTVEIQRQLPHSMVLSAGYTYKQTRRNIGETDTVPQGNTTLRVREFGDTRLPNVTGLDLSFRKTFRAGTRTIAPRLDIFNATNDSTVTARITQLGPTYGRISGIQRARLIKVGVNLEF
jgi:hypothetical protein